MGHLPWTGSSNVQVNKSCEKRGMASRTVSGLVNILNESLAEPHSTRRMTRFMENRSDMRIH